MIREDLDKMASDLVKLAAGKPLEEMRETFKVLKDFYLGCEMLQFRRKRANLDEPDERTPTFADFGSVTEEPRTETINDARVTPFHGRART